MTRCHTPAHRRGPWAAIVLGTIAAACGGGGSDSRSPTVPPASAPVASFTFSPAAPAVNQPVQFTDASAGSPNAARTGETMNSGFRVYKYPTTYPAFTGRALTPGDFIERYQ